jgi:ParB family chromosome partitioning protein
MAKTSSRLGRGLSSLIAGGTTSEPASSSEVAKPSGALSVIPDEEPDSFATPKMETDANTTEKLVEVSLDSLVANPYQPRKVIEPETIRELASSIASEGLLQPVVARKVGDKFELVAGERRWRAHQLLGKSKILVRVLPTSDVSSASLSLIENLQREGLNAIEEALGYNSLVVDFNLTQANVAERVGKSRTHVTNLIRLLQLDDELKVLLSSRKLNVGHAKVLLGIEDKDLRNEIGKKAAKEGWSVRQCENAVEDIKNPLQFANKQNLRSSNQLFANFAKLAEKSLDRKVSIKSDSMGKGNISLNFTGESDLIELLNMLGVTSK